MSLHFKYKADKKYFADKLTGGDKQLLESKYCDCFDFRSSAIKRQEYNLLKSKLLQILLKRSKGICEICKIVKGHQIDHIIPVASNQLNKSLRKMRPVAQNGKLKKVPSESYGSNHIKNLQLACQKCNRKKWHKF